jgi:hypothetical protein
VVLYVLYAAFIADEYIWFRLSDITKRIPGATNNVVSMALDALVYMERVAKRVVDVEDDIPHLLSPPMISPPKRKLKQYAISRPGIDEVERWDDQIYDEISKKITIAEESGIAEDDHDKSRHVDEWAPLPIERSAPEYEHAVSALEEAVETVRGDNGYAANAPEEHGQVLASLSTGLEWIKTKLPSRAQVRSLIVDTLNFLQQKFSGAVIGEVASRAAKAVVDWLKSLVV